MYSYFCMYAFVAFAVMATTTAQPQQANAAYAANITVIGTGGHNCVLNFAGRNMQCSLGKNGIAPVGTKVEGDGRTPQGSYLLRQVYYRQDRVPIPQTGGLQNVTAALQPGDGWCDDANAPEYNMHVTLPSVFHHEILWEEHDSFYDLFAVIGYNDDPPVAGLGSAIFFHVTLNYNSTAGCVAMALPDLQWVLSRLQVNTYMLIEDEADW